MLRQFYKKSNGQVLASEYVVVFALVTGVTIMMSIFFKRLFLGKMYDARNKMADIVTNRAKGSNYFGKVQYEYEPYYTNSIYDTVRKDKTTSDIIPGDDQGTYLKKSNQETTQFMDSMYLPPKDAK